MSIIHTDLTDHAEGEDTSKYWVPRLGTSRFFLRYISFIELDRRRSDRLTERVSFVAMINLVASRICYLHHVQQGLVRGSPECSACHAWRAVDLYATRAYGYTLLHRLRPWDASQLAAASHLYCGNRMKPQFLVSRFISFILPPDQWLAALSSMGQKILKVILWAPPFFENCRCTPII